MIETSPFPPAFQEETFRFITGSRKAMLNFGNVVTGTFFDDPVLSSLWEMVRIHFSTYRTVPTRGVMAELVRKAFPSETVQSIAQRATLTHRLDELHAVRVNPDPFVEQSIREWITYSSVRQVVVDIADDLMAGKYDPNLIKRFQEAVKNGQADADIGWFAKRDALIAVDRHADPSINPPIPTGIHLLDREMGGGLRKGQLGMLIAPPKGSKSTFLLNVAHNVPTMGVKKNCLYLTLELSEELQALRWAIKTAGIDKSMIIQNPAYFKTLYQRRAAAMFSPHHDTIIKFHPPLVCTPNMIRSLLDTIQSDMDRKVDVLCIDYLDLVGPDSNKGAFKAEKSYEVEVHIITDLRQIAVDYDLALWTASRTNREANACIRRGEWLGMEHMGGSFGRLGVVDICIAGQRFRDGMALVPIAVRNEGFHNKIYCGLQPSKMSIYSIGLIGDDEKPEKPYAKDEEEGGGEKPYRKKQRVIGSGPSPFAARAKAAFG